MEEKTSMDQSFLNRLYKAIESNLGNDHFGVDELALEVGVSKSQLHRKLNRLTGESASKIIREFRLKRAMEMLQNDVATASEISYKVGFSSPTYFSKCFHEYYGYPPGKVKRKKVFKISKKYSLSKKHIIVYLAAMTIVLLSFIFYIIVTNSNIITTDVQHADKSIAVLPFICLSGDPEKQYLADGAMDAILLHLSQIKDLRVISRTSMEQYRETTKTARLICKELDVSYLLEGSFQKQEDRASLIIQLIKSGIEGQVWAKEYHREWKDIFAVQSEIAETVARELQVVITPEEKQLIERKPTLSLTAYDFYRRGRTEQYKYWLDRDNRVALERAEVLFRKALEYDSEFAQAYTGLAWVYRGKHYWETYLSENFLDSMLSLADIALSFDDQLAEAYVIRGIYYENQNEKEKAIIEYDKAIKFNPNEWMAYRFKGWYYCPNDLVKALDNYHKAASLQRGPFLPDIYTWIGLTYGIAGFKEKAIYYVKEAFQLDDDSAAYYSRLATIEDANGNFDKAVELGGKSYAIDSTDLWINYLLGLDYLYLGQFEESLEYMKKWDRRLKAIGKVDGSQYQIGYAYWINGFKEEGRRYINTELEKYNKLAGLDRYYYKQLLTFYHLAAIYTFLGNKDKAYENLRLMNQMPRMPIWVIKDIENDPIFDSISDEQEFQQIVKDIEAKYQAEHERVRAWLEKKGMV